MHQQEQYSAEQILHNSHSKWENTKLLGGMLLVNSPAIFFFNFLKRQGHQNQCESVGTTKGTAFDNPQTSVFVKAGKVFFPSLCMSNLHKLAGSYLCSYVNPYAHSHADNNHRKCELNCIISCCAHNLCPAFPTKMCPWKLTMLTRTDMIKSGAPYLNDLWGKARVEVFAKSGNTSHLNTH